MPVNAAHRQSFSARRKIMIRWIRFFENVAERDAATKEPKEIKNELS